MKLRHLFLAAIVALGMMACNNEDVPAVKQNADGKLSVKVVPASNGKTRAIGLDNDGVSSKGLEAESEVHKTQVWVFVGNTLDGYGTAEGATVEDIGVSPGPRDIFIIVNGGSLGLTGSSTRADIEAAQATAPVEIDEHGLLMTCDPLEVTLVPGYNLLGMAKDVDKNYGDNDVTVVEDHENVYVTRVNARVAIADAKVDVPTDAEVVFDGLDEVEVAIFNVPEESEIFGDAGELALNADYLFGAAWETTLPSYVTTGTEKDHFLEDEVTFPIDALSKAPYFYVNENTSTDLVEQMLIVLRGKPYKGNAEAKEYVFAPGLYTDAAGYTYYPVWVNADKAGYTYVGDTGKIKNSQVLRNTQYNIYLTITKIGNPTIDPVEDAFLDVLVQVKDWDVVKQNVEWK